MEDPISESNNWVNGAATGLDWGNVQTTPGVAFGTVVSGGPPYNDSNASLTGTWRSDQSACGTVFMSGSLNRAGVPYEIEIELRHTIAAHNIIGYEFNYSMYNNGNQYMQIVRWNGSLNNFTILGGGSGTLAVLANGDVFCASAIGSTLKSWVTRNGAVIQTASVTDSAYSGGSPGMGFYNKGGALSDDSNYGFASFQASEINSSAGSTNVTVTAPVLVSIAVTPANPSITKSATQQFTATGTYSDSSTQNLTSSVTWSSTNTAVATITSGGLATGVATGSTTIRATSGSINGSTNLTVKRH
jgi:hypothetical protein